jgi:hypothetical protein
VKQEGEKIAKYMNQNYKTVKHQTLQEVRPHSKNNIWWKMQNIADNTAESSIGSTTQQ